MPGMADAIRPAVLPRDLPASPALSILAKAPATLAGRKVGILVGDGFDLDLVSRLGAAVEKDGAMCEMIAPKIGGARAVNGTLVPADHTLGGGPSVIFDAVVVVPGAAAVTELCAEPAAIAWVGDAFHHCKVIATVAEARPLLDAARVTADAGVIDLAGDEAIAQFVMAAKRGRVWSREAAVRGPDQPPLDSPTRPSRSSGSGRATARNAKR